MTGQSGIVVFLVTSLPGRSCASRGIAPSMDAHSRWELALPPHRASTSPLITGKKALIQRKSERFFSTLLPSTPLGTLPSNINNYFHTTNQTLTDRLQFMTEHSADPVLRSNTNSPSVQRGTPKITLNLIAIAT